MPPRVPTTQIAQALQTLQQGASKVGQGAKPAEASAGKLARPPASAGASPALPPRTGLLGRPDVAKPLAASTGPLRLQSFAAGGLAPLGQTSSNFGMQLSGHNARLQSTLAGPVSDNPRIPSEQVVGQLKTKTLDQLSFTDQDFRGLQKNDPAALAKFEAAKAQVAQDLPGATLTVESHFTAPGLGKRLTVTTPEGSTQVESGDLRYARSQREDAVFSHTVNSGGTQAILSSLNLRNNPNNLFGAGAYAHNDVVPASDRVTIHFQVDRAQSGEMAMKGHNTAVAFHGEGAHMSKADFCFPKENKFIQAERVLGQDGKPTVQYSVGELSQGLARPGTAKPIASLSDENVGFKLSAYE